MNTVLQMASKLLLKSLEISFTVMHYIRPYLRSTLISLSACSIIYQ